MPHSHGNLHYIRGVGRVLVRVHLECMHVNTFFPCCFHMAASHSSRAACLKWIVVFFCNVSFGSRFVQETMSGVNTQTHTHHKHTAITVTDHKPSNCCVNVSMYVCDRTDPRINESFHVRKISVSLTFILLEFILSTETKLKGYLTPPKYF